MTPRFALCLLLLAGALCGCSTDDLQRTGYAAVSNVGERQCAKDPGRAAEDCRSRQSYDAYQRSRTGDR